MSLTAPAEIIVGGPTWIESIRINRLERVEFEGRFFHVKRRRTAVEPLLVIANLFFLAAKNPIRVLTGEAEWLEWEVGCFLALHGAAFRAFSKDGALYAEQVPGRSLSQHLEAKTLTEEHCAAAGSSLAEAHALTIPDCDRLWSHGDPHLGNFIFDEDTGLARLIDFEVKHLAGMSAVDRHAEDLLAFLQDLCGRIAEDRWLPLANAFVAGYGHLTVARRLAELLVLPGGIPRIWWAVRTTYLKGNSLRVRLAALRECL